MVIWIIVILIVLSVIISISNSNFNKEHRDSEKENSNKWLHENNYNPTVDFSYESMMHDVNARFMVDESKKTILINYMSNIPTAISYKDVIGCEIREDSQVAGGIGRAVVGGVIAGGAGAIVGATTAKKQIESYEIVVLTSSISNPEVNIKLIKTKEKTDGLNYKNAVNFANRLNSTIKAIINQNQCDSSKSTNPASIEKPTYNATINNSTYNLEEIAFLMKQNEKIAAIKRLMEMTGMGLAEAKHYVESINWFSPNF